jgi:hypothetical protein
VNDCTPRSSASTDIDHPAHEPNLRRAVRGRRHRPGHLVLGHERVVVQEILVIIAARSCQNSSDVVAGKGYVLPHAIHAELDQALHTARPPCAARFTGHVDPTTLCVVADGRGPDARDDRLLRPRVVEKRVCVVQFGVVWVRQQYVCIQSEVQFNEESQKAAYVQGLMFGTVLIPALWSLLTIPLKSG